MVVYHAFILAPVAPGADPVSKLLAPVSNLGEIAVGVFFMLSGLFVAQSWLRDPHLLRFAARRVIRIVPGLFVCLLASMLVAVCAFSDNGWRGLFGPAPWRYVFGNAALHLLQYNIPPEELRLAGVLGGTDLNGPLWTLYWEGRMYVILALVGACAMLPMRLWLGGIAALLLLATNLMPGILEGYIWETRLWSFFLCGVLLQVLAARLTIGPIHVVCALVLLALNWTRFAALTNSPLTFLGLALVCSGGALALGTARLAGVGHLQRHDYSFGVYIYHWPVILMLKAALPPLAGPALLGATLVVVLPLAAMSWHLVELPALERLRRVLAKRQLTSVPVA